MELRKKKNRHSEKGESEMTKRKFFRGGYQLLWLWF